MTAPIVIVGAGMAGARACINLRANGYDGEIVLAGEEAHLPYDRPPLSKVSITQDDEPQLVSLMDETIARELKIETRTGAQVRSIDRATKSVTFANGSTQSYHKLLLATGAKPRRLSVPGGERALLLRNYEDALTLRTRFKSGQHAVIVGGGFIGLELASSAAKLGCSVTLVEAQQRVLMRGVPSAIAAIVHQRHVDHGVEMITGVGISHIDDQSVHLADGRGIAAATVIAGIGASPNTQLAEAAGLTLDNGIACDSHMRTSDADVFAAGDCASFVHRLFGGRRVRLEAWRSAQEQAATAAENMLGGSKDHAAVPWFWSDQYDLSLQIAGLADMGPVTVERRTDDKTVLQFHLAEDGKLMGASGIGVGNAIARDVKLAEMMIVKSLKPSQDALADPAQPLKGILKG
jgi:3-phenylpropionate/trans-cinnamate dioxygenase ferredoxin reductase component